MSNTRIKLKDRVRLISEYEDKARGWHDQARLCRSLKAWTKCKDMSEFYYRISRYHRWCLLWEVKHTRKRYPRRVKSMEELIDARNC